MGSVSIGRMRKAICSWLLSVPVRTTESREAAACRATTFGRAAMKSSPPEALFPFARCVTTSSGLGHLRCTSSKLDASSCCSCGTRAFLVLLCTHCTAGKRGAISSSADSPCASRSPTSCVGSSRHSRKRSVAPAAAGRSQRSRPAGPSRPRFETVHGTAPQMPPGALAGASGTPKRATRPSAASTENSGSETETATSGSRSAASRSSCQRPGSRTARRCVSPCSGRGRQPSGSTAVCSRITPSGSFSCVGAMTK
mmetsp:Transcript_32805/g.71522  ORF Transcript_32805/g.71522 Transcript_32805/m.71522 type:complete len:255 (-) Transcript_32805:3300-4064(-)